MSNTHGDVYHRPGTVPGPGVAQDLCSTQRTQRNLRVDHFLGNHIPNDAGTTIQISSSLPATPSFEFVSYVVS